MPGRRFTDLEEIKIVGLYRSGMSANAIGRMYGLPGRDAIIGALERAAEPIRPNMIANRLYNLREDAFDELTPEACYWWGFIYADGHVHRTRSLIVTLQIRDRSHLVMLAKFLGSNRPIKNVEVNGYGAAILSVTSQHMGRRLTELGIMAHRPHPEVIESLLPRDMIRHWLRGAFDGDGSVDYRQDQPRVRFCGNLQLVTWMRSTIAKACFLNPRLKLYIHPSGLVYLCYSGTNVVARLMDYLYQDAGPHLPRKRQKYEAGRH